MSSAGSKPPKPPKVCIFCGGNKLTGEHIWPDWAAPLFGPPSGVTEGYGVGGHPSEMNIRRKTRQGHVVQKKIYAVCGTCNSGWMSRLESAAKPVLTQLQAADSCSLDLVRQTILANWIVLKMMVVEHSIRNQAIFTQAARTAFMERREMPPNLQIWLFRCGKGRWRSGYARHASGARRIPISELPNVPTVPDNPPNVKSVSLGFNELFIHANFTVLADFKLDLEHDRFGVRLWPFGGGSINWPPAFTLSEEAATVIAETILRLPRITAA